MMFLKWYASAILISPESQWGWANFSDIYGYLNFTIYKQACLYSLYSKWFIRLFEYFWYQRIWLLPEKLNLFSYTFLTEVSSLRLNPNLHCYFHPVHWFFILRWQRISLTLWLPYIFTCLFVCSFIHFSKR